MCGLFFFCRLQDRLYKTGCTHLSLGLDTAKRGRQCIKFVKLDNSWSDPLSLLLPLNQLTPWLVYSGHLFKYHPQVISLPRASRLRPH
jgi:hypothetical protein